jgi:GntR family transcriptional repressor for pyruvate dehydrogenase complex
MSRTLTPVVRTTLSAAVFEQLIAFVVNGVWKAGDQIPPERDLCVELGVARTSLREALKAMELVGMLDSRVGEGTFVCPRSEFLARPMLWAFTGTDHSELKELLEARSLLEEDLAALAAERGSEDEIQAVGDSIKVMRANTEGGAVLDADMAFHLRIAAAAHNEILGNAVQLLRNMLRQWIYLKLLLPAVPDQVVEEHEAVYEAIRKRDVLAARVAMRSHLQKTAKLVEQVIRERNISGRTIERIK